MTIDFTVRFAFLFFSPANVEISSSTDGTLKGTWIHLSADETFLGEPAQWKLCVTDAYSKLILNYIKRVLKYHKNRLTETILMIYQNTFLVNKREKMYQHRVAHLVTWLKSVNRNWIHLSLPAWRRFVPSGPRTVTCRVPCTRLLSVLIGLNFRARHNTRIFWSPTVW